MNMTLILLNNIYGHNKLTLKFITMKKILLIGVALVMTACSSTNYVAHQVHESPKTTRQALIYEDHVVIVTRTKLSLEEYNKIVALTVNNRDERH